MFYFMLSVCFNDKDSVFLSFLSMIIFKRRTLAATATPVAVDMRTQLSKYLNNKLLESFDDEVRQSCLIGLFGLSYYGRFF